MPISGDLRKGGSFQLEGNAGGDILECERPRRFRVTFGGEASFFEIRLSPTGDGATTLELEHTVPIEMAQSGAGALWVGPGWDGGLLGLALFLAGEVAGGSGGGSELRGGAGVQRGNRSRPGRMRSRPPGRRLPSNSPRPWAVSMAQFAPGGVRGVGHPGVASVHG